MTSESSPGSLARWLSSDPTTAQKELDAELARRSLADFARQAWPIAEPAVPLVWNWHLDAICLHLEAVTNGEIRKLLINVPPGHAKSLFVAVLWPAWEWLTKPETRSLFFSYAGELSQRDSVKCRNVVTSSWYRETFRPEWDLTDDENRQTFFANDATGFRFAGSVTGSGTGWRGNKVVADDPLNRADADSAAAREECRRWWFEAMSSRLNDMRTGAHVIIMQRLHEEDLSGHVLKRGGYEHLCLPSEFEPTQRKVTSIGWTDPRKEEKELLFTELFPREVLDQAKKDLGSDGFAGQHQQSPVPAGGGKFKRRWFCYWEYVDDTKDLIRLTNPDGRSKLVKLSDCRKFGSVDLANSVKKSADYTVLAIWAVTPDSDLILLDVIRDRFEDPDIVPMLVTASKRWGLDYLDIEDNGLGLGVVQTARRAGLTVRGLHAHKDKVSRASTAIIRCEAGQIYFHASAHWLSDYEHELLTFPLGSHDDQVDVTSLAATNVFWEGGSQEPEEITEAKAKAAQEAISEAWHDTNNPAWWTGEDDD